MTNIIRDVGKDLRQGRIYLPLEDMVAFDYSEAELQEDEYDDRFVQLMEFEAKRAREFFARAAAVLPPEDRRIDGRGGDHGVGLSRAFAAHGSGQVSGFRKGISVEQAGEGGPDRGQLVKSRFKRQGGDSKSILKRSFELFVRTSV